MKLRHWQPQAVVLFLKTLSDMSVSPVPSTLLSGRSTPSTAMRTGVMVSPPPTLGSGSGVSTPSSTSSSKASTHKQKPDNIFSNDGSFLGRFQRVQKVGSYHIIINQWTCIDSTANCFRRKMMRGRNEKKNSRSSYYYFSFQFYSC